MSSKIRKSSARAIRTTAGLTVALPAMADAGPGRNHHEMMWGGGPGWFMGPIVWLLFLLLVVVIVMLLVRRAGPGGGTSHGSRPPGSSAKEILEERFARGEIDEDEFRKRKKALEE